MWSVPTLFLNAPIIIYDLLMILRRLTISQPTLKNFILRFRVWLSFSLLLSLCMGCQLGSSEADQPSAALLAIPEVTPRPTDVIPSPTPVPNYTRADAFEISTAVAENRALITPSPILTIQPVEDKEYLFPLIEDGDNFRETAGGIWYTTGLSAAEVQAFYLDDLVYYRWDYEIGEEGDGYADIQFKKRDARLQLAIWENEARGLTVVSMVDVELFLAELDELPSSVYGGIYPVIGDELGLTAEGGGIYTAALPLSAVRSFYLTQLLDAGWTPLPAVRETPSTLILTFIRSDGEISFRLEDVEEGTTVSWGN